MKHAKPFAIALDEARRSARAEHETYIVHGATIAILPVVRVNYLAVPVSSLPIDYFQWPCRDLVAVVFADGHVVRFPFGYRPEKDAGVWKYIPRSTVAAPDSTTARLASRADQT